MCEIIANQMELEPERVVIYDQRWEPPRDHGIYVVVSVVSESPFGLSRRLAPVTEVDVIRITMLTEYSIDVVSRGDDALTRNWEVAAALRSTYAIQQSEFAGVRIFRPSESRDISFVEGSAPLHRFQIKVSIVSVREKRPTTLFIDKYREFEVEHDA